MIGVVATSDQTSVVEEFFELFKTPWEFYSSNKLYDIIISTKDIDFELDAELIFISSAKSTNIDTKYGIKVTGTRKNITELRENINLWRTSASRHQSDREKILRDIAVIEERIRSNQEQYEIVKSELVKLGWKCKTSFGGTGLFIYSTEEPPPSCWEEGLIGSICCSEGKFTSELVSNRVEKSTVNQLVTYIYYLF